MKLLVLTAHAGQGRIGDLIKTGKRASADTESPRAIISVPTAVLPATSAATMTVMKDLRILLTATR